MAIRKVRATLHECDGCGRQFLENPETNEPVEGYHGGSIFYCDSRGGGGAKSWFACSSDCIVKAIHHVIDPDQGA